MLSRPLFAAFCLCLPAFAQGPVPGEFRFGHEGVLGTSCELRIAAADAKAAAVVEAATLAEIDRLAAILSSWDEHSELQRLVAAAGPVTASKDLLAVLDLAEHWRQASDGAFQPGVAGLALLWRDAVQHGAPPDAAAVDAWVAKLRQAPWTRRGDRVRIDAPISLDGVAKGYILDRASAVGSAAVPGARVLLLAIGGDMRLRDTAPRSIGVRDPRRHADNDEPLGRVALQQGGIASSGGYARGFDLGGVHHSHLFDPRSGQPADGVLGATVVAEDAATADALATSVCVLGAERGLELLAASHAEGVLVTADGVVHQSPGFGKLMLAASITANASLPLEWPQGQELAVQFDIRGSQQGGRGGWRRPYVAAWIEDPQGRPVRTLCLWIDSTRWLRDLRRWNRLYRELPGFVDVVSQATRRAGHYTLVWDGLDDDQQPVMPGEFVFCLEAAREHGTYQLIKKTVTVGGGPFAIELEGNTEIESASLRFGSRAAK